MLLSRNRKGHSRTMKQKNDNARRWSRTTVFLYPGACSQPTELSERIYLCFTGSRWSYPVTRTLTILDIEENEIENKGVEYLADALKINRVSEGIF